MSKKKNMTVSETIRAVIRESGLSLYRIAQDCHIGYAIIHRFMVGERGLAMETLDRLCANLGLRLVKDD
jgi:plasmid maintenance system antidote protein VapI